LNSNNEINLLQSDVSTLQSNMTSTQLNVTNLQAYETTMTGTVYQVELHELFDPNDISIAVNDLITNAVREARGEDLAKMRSRHTNME
jgi:hypothetical protein